MLPLYKLPIDNINDIPQEVKNLFPPNADMENVKKFITWHESPRTSQRRAGIRDETVYFELTQDNVVYTVYSTHKEYGTNHKDWQWVAINPRQLEVH